MKCSNYLKVAVLGMSLWGSNVMAASQSSTVVALAMDSTQGDAGLFIVALNHNVQQAGCTTKWPKLDMARSDMSMSVKKSMIALATTAKVTGSGIVVYTDSCTNGGQDPSIYRIDIR
jgi:Zn-dependent protease with chaperone function